MLEVEELRKSYKDVEAVRGVSFKVGDGEVFALIGPNGAGKTTTLKCIMGFLRCDGKISYDGKEIDENFRVENFSFLPEDKRLYPEMKVSEILKMVERIGGHDPETLRKLVESFSLPLKSKVLELSHGMRTLLYISIVFSKRAKLYMLDEPTWGLDPLMRKKVFEMMNDLVADGKSILYTSHILPEVEKIADVLAIMKGGRIVFMEDLETIRGKYRIAFTRVEPSKSYEHVKKAEAGYIVLAREEELDDTFETIAPVDVEDVFDVVVGGDSDA